jgi:phospholipase/carboxylesterase
MSESLYYIQRKPKVAPENAPLLVLLHGYGSHEQDLFSFAEELPDELRIISVRAPHNNGFGGFAWYAINFDADENKFSDLDQARESLIQIKELITELKATYHPSKVFLLGFSQGAILSYAFSLNYPNQVNHVVALSGYLIHDLLPTSKETEISTDYYISHGTVDQVIPVDWARKAPQYLKALDLSCVYSEYPVGHGVAPQNFYSFRDWIVERL